MKRFMKELTNNIHQTKIKRLLMKTFLSLTVVYIIAILLSCTPAQPKSNYEVTWTASTGAVKYLVFLEERSTNTGFTLVDNMDYLAPDVSALKIAEPTTTSYTVQLNNDGKYVVAGVVAVDVAGFYSYMAVSAVTQKGSIPPKPGSVIFKKK